MAEKKKFYRVSTAAKIINMPERTLHGYIKAIERETSYRFYRKTMFYHSNKVNQVFLTEEEIPVLTELRRIRELDLLPMRLAIYKLFDPEKYREYTDFESQIL